MDLRALGSCSTACMCAANIFALALGASAWWLLWLCECQAKAAHINEDHEIGARH